MCPSEDTTLLFGQTNPIAVSSGATLEQVQDQKKGTTRK